MGQSYSAGPVAPRLQSFVGLPLEEVRCKRLAFIRMVLADNGTSGGGSSSAAAFTMSRSQFSQLFGIKKPEDSYDLYSVFDPVGNGTFNSIDLFGGMVSKSKDGALFLCRGRLSYSPIYMQQALLSRATLDARLRFIISLIDLNHDDRLNPSELTILVRCVTRGVARLKKLEAPSLRRLQTIVSYLCFTLLLLAT